MKLSPVDKPPPGGSNTELRRVMRERDELQALLDRFEKHMAEVRNDVIFESYTCNHACRIYYRV